MRTTYTLTVQTSVNNGLGYEPSIEEPRRLEFATLAEAQAAEAAAHKAHDFPTAIVAIVCDEAGAIVDCYEA